MRKLILLVAFGLVLLPGCSRHYVIRMSNGVQLTTSSKPKLKGESYYFKDHTGTVQSIPAGRIEEIAPASRAKEGKDSKSFFKSDGR